MLYKCLGSAGQRMAAKRAAARDPTMIRVDLDRPRS